MTDERRPWRSLEDREREPAPTPEFAPGETDPPEGVRRRDFLQLLAATMAAGGAAACSRPEEEILPYAVQPELVTPGVPLHYATALPRDGFGFGVVARAREGRPVKVEGNPRHPASLGATGAAEQAALVELYDPRRTGTIRRRGVPRSRTAFLQAMRARAEAHAEDAGEGLAVLLEPVASPFLEWTRARLQERFPRARFFAWDPVSRDAVREAAELCFGRRLEPVYELVQATVIVALDDDLLSEGAGAIAHARAFASRRVPERDLNRLYAVESRLTVTGAAADHRLRATPPGVAAVAADLLAALARLAGRAAPPLPVQPPRAPGHAGWVEVVAADLWRRRGRSLVTAGPRQPVSVHVLVHAMNALLGNIGVTVRMHPTPFAGLRTGPDALAGFTDALVSGSVRTALVTAFDPVRTAPADVPIKVALERAGTSVCLHALPDRSSRACEWAVPAAHPFESWGDIAWVDGTTSIVQPLIRPLFGGFTQEEILASLLGETESTYFRLRRSWRERRGVPGFDDTWRAWLQEGVVPGTAVPSVAPSLIPGAVAAAFAGTPPAPEVPGPLILEIHADEKMRDGRHASNAWLLELPDPITKISWDNALRIPETLARERSLSNGDVVRLRAGSRLVDAAVWITPGQAEGVVSLPLGYGAEHGLEGTRAGFDATPIRTRAAPWFVPDVSLERTGRKHELACTQEHGRLDGRDIVVQATPATLDETVHHLEEKRRHPLPTLLERPEWTPEHGYKWAMGIDLSRCLGCGSCTIACQAENNVPAVGKTEVAMGREMYWLRIDRYWMGAPDQPQTVFEPMLCQHCEEAPCEYVCPVNATVHDEEGLNQMVYNRCVGTRYCSNNCAWKVRRFNWYDYQRGTSPLAAMIFNPEVTVRERGVMEKCTFCIQRIETARIEARKEGHPIPDRLQTACAQACPTGSIVFGSLHDEASRVSAAHRDPRHFYVLGDLGTHPRIAYLLKMRNPNPDLVT